MDPALHPDVEPIAFLLGAWRGEGQGDWPTSGSFRYGEEMTFEHEGKAFLLYSQRSWAAEERTPLHFERGFFRLAGPGRVEVVLAHPLGIVEVAEGTLSGTAIEVASRRWRSPRPGPRSPSCDAGWRSKATSSGTSC